MASSSDKLFVCLGGHSKCFVTEESCTKGFIWVVASISPLSMCAHSKMNIASENKPVPIIFS